MKIIHLDTPMKLMKYNNEAFPHDTQFIYNVPHYIFDTPGLQVVCSLVEDTKMAYILSEAFHNIQAGYVAKIESLLWGLSTYAKVQLQDSNGEVLLLKQGLYVKK